MAYFSSLLCSFLLLFLPPLPSFGLTSRVSRLEASGASYRLVRYRRERFSPRIQGQGSP
ncbi:predicted protein [Chaetomium globosum CBS 148.51]|uniref:Uncharacterized protein n=1 Tax=Chaetomium globosum (strain ATCC 6205 / CBS 148.51 / DSM 1962 / NBRC 6347 / NRRL 1970) TaxID=306901 RepID=Q2HGE4_CHAGB|nr:uncharacterized protein CHGG_00710 [Chaetomium globosum CBS 148.51]EAQ92475.1 predicted protein [Chaetomium globosum CBS 148.51]